MFKDKVAESIRAVLPNVDTSHLMEKNGRVTGYVVDEQFRDDTIRAAVDRVWDQLSLDLGKEAANVGFLLFITPETEASAAQFRDAG